MRKHRISGVEPGSIAQELRIEEGDYLISLDDRPVQDVLDYRFRISTECVCAKFMSESGQVLTADIEKQADEDLGLEFETPLMDKIRRCTNRCIFCFVDQLPQDVRPSLKFKDDDYRMSFLQGNFVTLTNVGKDEIMRIVDQRISPIHISVHTTDAALRARMLQNKNAAFINEQLEALVSGGISFYAQIVVCPGVNDGEELTKTYKKLATYRPFLKEVAVVPVGLTQYRSGLPDIKPVTQSDAVDVVERTKAFMNALHDDYIQLADEFYLIADKPLPEAECYGEFAQMEDGVGMMRHLVDGFMDALGRVDPHRLGAKRSLSVATGEAAYPFIRELCQKAQRKTGMPITVYPVKNTFFGGGVTVTGLLTGKCLVNGLAGKPLGDLLLLSKCMTKAGEPVLLDDITVEELSRALKTEVWLVDNDGASLLRALCLERE